MCSWAFSAWCTSSGAVTGATVLLSGRLVDRSICSLPLRWQPQEPSSPTGSLLGQSEKRGWLASLFPRRCRWALDVCLR